MKLLTKEHRNGGRVIPAAIQKEVMDACDIDASKKTKAVQTLLGKLQNEYGWSDRVKVCPEAEITITAKKGEIGLCFQTGNMARFYADLLKLELLFQKELIHGAIYILPDKHLAKVWGENIANFERFTKEVSIFAQIIHTPLLIIGMTK